jgi:hypothetical protein
LLLIDVWVLIFVLPYALLIFHDHKLSVRITIPHAKL